MASMHEESFTIDWLRLLKGFPEYEPDESMKALDGAVFVESLLEPPLGFVTAFLQQGSSSVGPREDRVKALYGYLLQRRYEERLNLLYFAFHVFDEETRLPQEIIDQTPLPHEDGVPPFRLFGQPGFSLEPTEDPIHE